MSENCIIKDCDLDQEARGVCRKHDLEFNPCRVRGKHRTSVSGLTGAAWCLDCDWDEGD